jgi:sugar O-acyltransferase (sialic acid O-acetyltransferase NeuD family)
MATPIVIWGAGGHALVVRNAMETIGGFSVVGHLLDDGFTGSSHPDLCPLLGGYGQLHGLLQSGVSHVFVAIGDNWARIRTAKRLAEAGFVQPVIVHPRAVVCEGAFVGAGTFVAAGAVVGAAAHVGSSCIINTGATVDHECRIASGVHISPGSHLAGRVTLGEGTWIGIGSCILDRRTVGEWSVVGAGSVVTRDLPPRVVAYGSPARIIRPNNQNVM